MSVNLLPAPFPLGDMTVRRVMEMQMPFRMPAEMFPNADPETLAALTPEFTPWAIDPESGKAIIAVQSYLVRTSRHTILIDTCIGCDKTNPRIPAWAGRTDRRWLKRLGEAGVAPEEVDFVLCTHMHPDHSGWNTQLVDGRWVPTFPNARYIISRAEVEWGEQAGIPQYDENVLPVIRAGQAELVEGDYALDDEIWLEPIPGHTPGMVAVHLASGATHGVMWGDLLHSPMQCLHPEWWFMVDADPEQGVVSRRKVLGDCAEHGRLVLPAHFPSPSVGRVDAEGDAFRFRLETPEG